MQNTEKNETINSAVKLAETIYRKMKKNEYSMVDYYAFRSRLNSLVREQTKVGGSNDK